MTNINGQYYDGKRAVGSPAKILFEGEEAQLTTNIISVSYPIKELRVSPRIASARRFILLPDGAQFMSNDHPFFNSLPQESPSEGFVAWLEKRWAIALACVLIITSALLAGYFFGLPIAAKKIVSQIPLETEHAIGAEALGWLDKQKWFKPTALSVEQRQAVEGGFGWLNIDLPFQKYYHLEFRSSKMFGANAMALPGGIIVITDDLVNLAQDNQEVMAILAHEIGHVELRHSMTNVIQNSAVAATVATLTADAASLSAAVAGLPAILAQTKYSREFETAADDYAFSLLKQKYISPEKFASIMERLSEKYEKDIPSFAYISTHPLTRERINRARAAAADGPHE
ncbi:MAG: M48 family metallopeptidase [Syntrophaceae bacterium]|nr:M48 family metallopeptidase [Syntrophaceae bacterium]